jgi:ribonuclease BN (tRNA processing enzyme)
MEHLSFSNTQDSFIKVLGANGGKSHNTDLTSLQIGENIVIDAGNLANENHDSVSGIDHILITHSHLDHIVDIAFLIDNTFELRKKPLKVYGRKGNLDNIKKHLLNWEIWPDFTQIPLINSEYKAIELIEIELDKPFIINDLKLTAIENNHTHYSNGYIIEKNNSALLFTSDTYSCDSIWEKINTNKNISTLIIDVSFPSRMEKLAIDSKHFSPILLKKELEKLHRDDITLHLCHIKPYYQKEIASEVEQLQLLLNGGTILKTSEIVSY